MKILFRNSAFRTLLISFLITNLGTYFSYMLLIVLSYQSTKSTTLTMGVLLSLSIARLLAGTFAGVIVDRSLPKKILLITNLFNAFLISTLYFAPSTKVWFIYFICFLMGICGSFLAPAFRKFQVQITTDDEIGEANATLQFVQEITKIFGPGLAVFVLYLLPQDLQTLGYVIDGCSYVVAGILIYIIKEEGTKRVIAIQMQKSQKSNPRRWRQEIIEGLEPLKNLSIASIYILYLLISIAIAGFDVLIIAHISQLKLTALYVGYIISAISVGLIIATLLYRFIERVPVAFQLAGSACGIGLFYSLLGRFDHIILLIGSAVLLGFFNGLYNVSSSSYIQRRIPFEKLGRFSGITTSFFSVVTIVGMSINGLLGSITSPGLVISVMGSFIVLVGGISIFTISYSEKKLPMVEQSH